MVLDSNQRTSKFLFANHLDVPTVRVKWPNINLPTTCPPSDVQQPLRMPPRLHSLGHNARDQKMARRWQSHNCTNQLQQGCHRHNSLLMGHQLGFSGGSNLAAPEPTTSNIPMRQSPHRWYLHSAPIIGTRGRRLPKHRRCRTKQPQGPVDQPSPSRTESNKCRWLCQTGSATVTVQRP